MNKLNIYQVDAFTQNVFGGNPAAVCFMDQEFPDQILQNIAAENNLAETAYIWRSDDHFKIRWFTPTVEVDLCGHATLASAYVLFNILNYPTEIIRFDSRSGPLFVTKENDGKLVLDFPTDNIRVLPRIEGLEEALGCKIIQYCRGKSDFLVEIENEEKLKGLQPDFSFIKQLDSRGLIVTSAGVISDFVSRCFFPQSGIDEDPVTGSAHTTLAPYWAPKLLKTEFYAKQLSPRGGELFLQLNEDRIKIGGYAALYLIGELYF